MVGLARNICNYHVHSDNNRWEERMSKAPITMDELARRAAVRFLLDDCRSHPDYETSLTRAGIRADDIAQYKGAPPAAALSVIQSIHGLEALESLSQRIKETLATEGNKSVEALRPSDVQAITGSLACACDDHGIGGVGLTAEGVYKTLMAERDQLMRESKTHS